MFLTDQRTLDVPRQQRLEVFEGVGRRQLRIGMSQIGVRLDPVRFRRLDQRVEVSARRRAARGVTKQPCLASDHERADRILTAIVVQRHLGVLEEHGELRPLTESIVDGLAERLCGSTCPAISFNQP